MFAPEFDLTSSENLDWLAVLGSSVLLSLASSLVPNYAESALDVRSHNRARLFNETAARLHIAYIIFLLALMTSNDIDKTGNKINWLITLTVILVFVLMWSTIVSGRTIKRIRKCKDKNGNIHQCRPANGVCQTPIDWWMGCKICLANGLVALIVGVICLGLAISPPLIKHDDSRSAAPSELKNYYDGLRRTYDQIARKTKDEFEEQALGIREVKSKDPDLHASYWYRSDNDLYQLGTTHHSTAKNTYKFNEGSIIGCGFVNKNSSVRWPNKDQLVDVWPYIRALETKASCKYEDLHTANITSIACATYNGSADQAPEHTVGICVFTTGKIRNIAATENYHHFLQKKAEEYYDAISPLLAGRKLMPR